MSLSLQLYDEHIGNKILHRTQAQEKQSIIVFEINSNNNNNNGGRTAQSKRVSTKGTVTNNELLKTTETHALLFSQ